MQSYLRRAIINAIRDRIRRLVQRPVPEDLPEDLYSDDLSPLEQAIANESYERYRAALATLRPLDRELVVARVEAQWTASEIAERFGYRSDDAARIAAGRAIRRLRDAFADLP